MDTRTQLPTHYRDFNFIERWLVPLPGSALDRLATEIKAEVEGHENRTRKRKPVDAERFDHLIRAVVANLAREFLAPSKGAGWLGTKFTSGRSVSTDYSDCPAFGPQWKVIAATLETMGLIEKADGDIPRGKVRGTSPSIKATAALLDRIQRIHNDIRFARHADEPVIVLSSNRWIQDEDTHEFEKETTEHTVPKTALTIAISRRVARLNNTLANLDIAVVNDDGTWSRSFSGQLPLSVRRRFTIAHEDVEATGLAGYRYDLCGRLYGGFWQTMRKAERHRIRINGEPGVMVDYRSMNAHIAYSLVGKTPPLGDLYAVPGLEGYRPEVKKLFNAMLAWPEGRKFARWPKSIREGKGPLTRARIGPRMASGLIAEHHKDISELFASGRILEIQYIESETLLRVIDTLFDRDIIGLPVHDAMIVQAKDAEEVAGIMREAAMAVVGVPIDVSL